MLSRFVLFACLTLALFVAYLPASWMDAALSELTEGRLRLASSEGSVWRGSAMLALADGQRRLLAVRALEWQLGVQRAPASLAFDLQGSGRPLARLRLRPAGVQIELLDLDLPLASLAQALAHPAAKAGWQGRLEVRSKGVFCDWQGRCEGRLVADWLDAALAIVPGRRFGDHRLDLVADRDALRLHLYSLDSDFLIEARGTLERGGRFALLGTIEGDPEIVDRLPNILDGNARPTGVSGRTSLHFP